MTASCQQNATQSEELKVLQQLFTSLSKTDKRSFLASLGDTQIATSPNTPDSSREVNTCPHCGSTHFVKNGRGDGKQRYLCRDCRKSFVEFTGTILASSKKDLSVWANYVHCMIEKYPLRRCAKECGITLQTAFLWRHKILDALQNMMSEVTLDGVVEADETFMNISDKGNHKNFKLPRKSFKRGGKVCIPCGINLNSLSIAKISKLGKPKWSDIEKVLGRRVETGSVFVNDSYCGYTRWAWTTF